MGWTAGVLLLAVMVAPARSHHSYAMFDVTKARTMTGRLVRYIPGANHAHLVFDVLDASGEPLMENGKPARWSVETGSAAALARMGVAPNTFPEGTIFTVALYPLRDGRPFGAMARLLIKCGVSVPPGGCTKETGQVLVAGNAPD